MTLRLWGGALAPDDIAPRDGIAIGPALREKEARRHAPQSTLKLWGKRQDREARDVKLRFNAPPDPDQESEADEGSDHDGPVRISWRTPSASD